MAENSVTEGDPPTKEVSKKNVVDDAVSKPLKMSFADWKKSKEEKETDSEPARRNGRQPHKNDSKQQQSGNRNNHNNINNSSGNNNNNNSNNSYAPLSRPPPMPFPLMSMGFGNFGSQPMMPPAHNMGNMGSGQGSGPGPGPGPGLRNHRPLQPPPFWQDMMSPQHRTPPIQPPMPKCPSLWNLVPKDKGKKQPQNQPNKKYKTSNNTNNNSNKSTDAALMPPPPAPKGSNSSSSSNSSSTTNNSNNNSQNGVVKKKKGGTFVQIDGKWIQRPEAPPPLEEAPPGTKEDRQRQWREYRQAMKPFKNREFHNWKRTVQRLSKLPRNTLDERQLERLQKAEEYIGAHKAMLTIKHAEHWVQQNNQKPENPSVVGQGQVYVRKQAVPTWNRKDNHNTFQQGSVSVRKQTFGTGRAIKGGIGSDLNHMPSLPITAPPPPIGQFPDLTCPPMTGGYFGQTQGYNSTLYGQEGASNNSNPFYANYNSSFVKGGTLLPP